MPPTIIDQLTPQLPAGYRVLEVGCGTGNTLRVLKDACSAAGLIVGMDVFQEGLAFARRRTDLPLVRARIEQAPFHVPFEFMAALYPIARVSRWLSRHGNDVRRQLGMKAKSAVQSDLTVWPVINGIIGRVLRQEAPMLRRRRRLRMGTSLLAVARAV